MQQQQQQHQQQSIHKNQPDTHHYIQEEKLLTDNIQSFIDPDYVLNCLNNNELDNLQKNCLAYPTFYPALHHDLNFQLTSLNQFQHRSQNSIAGLPNIFEKTIPTLPQDQWILHNYNESQKCLSTIPNPNSNTNLNNTTTTTPINTNNNNNSTHLLVNLNPIRFDLNNTKMNTLNNNNNNENEQEYGKFKKLKRNESEKKLNELVSSNNLASKMNIKNTYINKINTLISDPRLLENESEKKFDDKISSDDHDSLLKQEMSGDIFNDSRLEFGFKKVRSYDILKSDDIEKINDKLARNRESARNSRKRKKIYIELLERKVDQLTKELEITKKQLETNNENLNKMCFKSKLMNSLINGRMQLFERLEKMLATTNDETELNLLIDSLRLRLGANGKERIDAINYFFKQIIDILIPVHMKYLLWAASEGKDVFNSLNNNNNNNNNNINLSNLGLITSNLSSPGEKDVENSGYWNELLTQVNLTESQKKNIGKYRKKIILEKQRFINLIGDLNTTRKAILKQANSLQNVIDDFRNILSPSQVGKFLIVLDKERNRKEFSAEKLWQCKGINRQNSGNLSDSDGFLNDMEKSSQSEAEELDTSINSNSFTHHYQQQHHQTHHQQHQHKLLLMKDRK